MIKQKTSRVIKYSAPKNTPDSYFPTSLKTIGLNIEAKFY